MPKTIEAIYENGVFKPLSKIPAMEHERFKIIYFPVEEESSLHLLQIAEEGGSFDFLKEKGEDIYSLDNGEEI